MFVFKVFVSIAIVILCNIFCDEVSAKITISCPAFGTENAKSMPVMYPVPGDCSSFYVCANGELVKFACSNGTVFNPKSNVICQHLILICDFNHPKHISITYRYAIGRKMLIATATRLRYHQQRQSHQTSRLEHHQQWQFPQP